MARPPRPLNLNIPPTQLQPRTALQTTIEQQAIRTDVVTRSFSGRWSKQPHHHRNLANGRCQRQRHRQGTNGGRHLLP